VHVVPSTCIATVAAAHGMPDDNGNVF
jgi:hypothetical protein